MARRRRRNQRRRRRRRATRRVSGGIRTAAKDTYRGVFTFRMPLGTGNNRTIGGFFTSPALDPVRSMLDSSVGAGRIWTHVRVVGLRISAPPIPGGSHGGSYDAGVMLPNVATYAPAVFKDDQGRAHPGEWIEDYAAAIRLLSAARSKKSSGLGRPIMWNMPVPSESRAWIDRASMPTHRFGIGGHPDWVWPWPAVVLVGSSATAVAYKDIQAVVELQVEALCDYNPFDGLIGQQVAPPRASDVSGN